MPEGEEKCSVGPEPRQEGDVEEQVHLGKHGDPLRAAHGGDDVDAAGDESEDDFRQHRRRQSSGRRPRTTSVGSGIMSSRDRLDSGRGKRDEDGEALLEGYDDEDEEERVQVSVVNVEASDSRFATPSAAATPEERRHIDPAERAAFNHDSSSGLDSTAPVTNTSASSATSRHHNHHQAGARDDSTTLLLVSPNDPNHPAAIIQVDSSQCSSEGAGGASSAGSNHGGLYGCNGKSMCGPHPVRISVAIFIVLSVWTSIILGVHVHKKVSTMEDELAKTSQDLSNLQSSYLALKGDYDKEIDMLRRAVQELAAGRMREAGRAAAAKSSRGPAARSKKRRAKKSCRTTDGETCAFPFIYEDKSQSSCHTNWKNPKPWCATEVDEHGYYAEGKWGYCGDDC